MTFLSHSEAETEDFAASLAPHLRPGRLLACTGGLGSGKTAFARGLARGLGCSGRVSSPTYTIVNEYPGPVPLLHFDLYRLSSLDELFDIGWDDYLARPAIALVEWSERFPEALPPDAVSVGILRCPEDPGWRRITIEGISGL